MNAVRHKTLPRCSDLQREIVSQLEKAILETAGTTSSTDKSIHSIRLRCKRLRADLKLLRLAGSNVSRRAASHVREASAILSPFRDAQIVPTAIQRIGSLDEQGDTALADSQIAKLLMESVQQVARSEQSLSRALIEAADHFCRARKLVSKVRWKKNEGMTAEVLRPDYRIGRRSVSLILQAGDREAFHQLRKDAKTHLYQCRFMKRAYADALTPHIKLVKELGDLLGQAQDIAVLQNRVTMIESTTGSFAIEEFQTSCDRLTGHLHGEATRLACQIFFLKPRRFVKACLARDPSGRSER